MNFTKAVQSRSERTQRFQLGEEKFAGKIELNLNPIGDRASTHPSLPRKCLKSKQNFSNVFSPSPPFSFS